MLRLLLSLIAVFFIQHSAVGQPSIPPAADSAGAIQPLLVGDRLPDLSVKDLNGEVLPIRNIAAQQPTILVFYRGGWCPYCNQQLAGLQRIVGELNQIGYQIAAVSADRPSKLKSSSKKHDISYTLYSDNTMELARAMGVAFNVAPATIKRYKSMGLDLAEASGHNHGILPVPSVFILDRRGKIQFQYVNPNYKVRLKSRVLLAAAKAYYNKSQSKPDSGH